MHYELNVTITLESDCDPERVAKQFESLFEFGTIKEAIAEGLRLGDDPRLVGVAVKAERNKD
jgi:hypothetical protein